MLGFSAVAETPIAAVPGAGAAAAADGALSHVSVDTTGHATILTPTAPGVLGIGAVSIATADPPLEVSIGTATTPTSIAPVIKTIPVARRTQSGSTTSTRTAGRVTVRYQSEAS